MGVVGVRVGGLTRKKIRRGTFEQEQSRAKVQSVFKTDLASDIAIRFPLAEFCYDI
jgi:hypothetical protein